MSDIRLLTFNKFPSSKHKRMTCKFRAVKQHLGGHQFHSSDEVEMAVCEWLQKQQPNLDHNGSCKLMLRLDKYIEVPAAYNE
jgi:hypothetical protein